MALVNKGYIGDSSVSAKMGNTYISNGVVQKAYGGVGTGGQNLRSQGYPNYYATSSSSTRSTGGSSGGSSRSSSGSSSSSSSGSASGYNAGDAYAALLAAYRNDNNDDYLRQMREAAQNAYDRGMNALNSAYDTQMSSLGGNLNETRNQLANQYNRSRQNILDDAANSLKQAYINRMLSEKNLGQQMSAMGLTGGATETSLAGLLNNYGNARNNIYTTQNKNLSNLEGNYAANLSQAMQAYNSAVADANLQRAQQAMNLENALANNQISAIDNYQSILNNRNSQYLDLLKAAIANGASFAYTPTEATNGVNAVAVNQTSNPIMSNNLLAIQELMNQQNLPGKTTPGMTVINPATQGNSLAQFIANLQRG